MSLLVRTSWGGRRGKRGVDECSGDGGCQSVQVVGADARSGAGAVVDDGQLAGEQVGIGGAGSCGFGVEEVEELSFGAGSHNARRVHRVLELYLSGHVGAAL